MYEESRFIQSLLQHASKPISDLVLGLYKDIFDFTKNLEPHDDITILALRRHE
jgi:serine phosphatase RsbU (regulator of sigma subunit)